MLLDIAFLVSIVYGIMQGSKGGFIKSFLNIAKHIFAIIIAAKLLYVGADNMGDRLIGNAPYSPLLIFILGYIVIVWFLTMITKSATEELKLQADGTISQGLGVAFWIFILSFFFSGIVNLVEQTDLVSPTLFASSVVYPWINEIYPIVKCKFEYVVPAIGTVFDAIQQIFYDLGGLTKGNCCN